MADEPGEDRDDGSRDRPSWFADLEARLSGEGDAGGEPDVRSPEPPDFSPPGRRDAAGSSTEPPESSERSDQFDFSSGGSDPPERADRPEPDASGGSSHLGDLAADVDHRAETSSWDDVDRDSGERVLSASKSQALLELLGDARNVLLLGPLLCLADYEVGTALLNAEGNEPVNLVLVTFTQSPDERLAVCETFLDVVPERTTVIGVGSGTRSSDSDATSTADGAMTVKTVPDPADLKRIGITIDKTLQELEASGRQTLICFHSLTALLQYVDQPRRLFRFLNILRGRTRRAGARAHYHMERGVHDEQLVSMIRPVFDAVVTYDEDGSVSIDT